MRYGIVGTGFWARETHAAAVRAHRGAELVGVWGRDRGKREDMARAVGAEPMAEPEELFAAVDAVCFAVPPHVQAPLAVEAARAGCHLLLEKPLALDPDEADAVVDAIEEAGVASVVFFTSRFSPPLVAWLDETRRRGGWTGGHAAWLGSIFHEGNPFGSSPWRQEHGGLWDIGPHALSMVLPLLGPVASVDATGGPDDTAHLVLAHEGGATSTLTTSLSVPRRAAKDDLSLYGELGWERMPEGPRPGPVVALREALVALETAVGGGPAHECDASFARDVTHVLHRAAEQLG